MKTTLLALALLLAAIPISAQTPFDDLMKQGIKLHDSGQYQAAIDKYNEALKLQPKSKLALYETALSYSCMPDHNKCIVYGLKALGIKDGDTGLDAQIYNLLGSTYDDIGQSEKALKIYDEGLAKMENHLLYFNKGLTHQRLGNYNAALECYKNALTIKSNHPSSYYYIARLYDASNDVVSAFFYYINFMIYEPNTNRTQTAFKNLFAMGEGNTITIPGDDQQTLHTALSIALTAIGLSDKEGVDIARTPYDKLLTVFRIVYEMKDKIDVEKLNDNFCAHYYVPAFFDICDAGYMEAFCRYLSYYLDEGSQTWVNENEEQFETFIHWMNTHGEED